SLFPTRSALDHVHRCSPASPAQGLTVGRVHGAHSQRYDGRTRRGRRSAARVSSGSAEGRCSMRHRLQVVLQILLALVGCLLGIATNSVARRDEAPGALEVSRRGSVPASGLLIVAMVIGQVVVYRLENPTPERAEWPRDRIPYPGLDAYSEEEAAVYFGREAQAAELTRRLHASAPGPADRFLLLTGASGSGKSSLVRAGVLPRLRRRRWTIVPAFSPGANPLHALAASLAVAGGGQESAGAVLRRLRHGPESLGGELSRLRGGQFQRVLLVIDQLEELVTLASERERAQFLETLHACLQQEPSVRVLATCRVDLLGRLLGTDHAQLDRKSTRLNSSHVKTS